MKNSVRAFFAIYKGLQICFSKPKVRRLAMIPWLLGAVCYFASIYGAYYAHPILLDWAVGSPDGIWKTILFWLAFVFFGLVLLVATLLVTMTLVIVFTSVFQTGIVQQVLLDLGRPLPEEEAGVKGIVKETGRTVVVEMAKLIWLLPLMIIVLIVGFIPLLTPFALILGAWLLAYQFVDIVLDVYRVTSRERFRFAKKHAVSLIAFGLSLSACWAIPFFGILLPPAAVAGAAWLLSESGLLAEFEENALPESKTE